MNQLETAKVFVERHEATDLEAVVHELEARDAAVAQAAKLQALCDMYNTAMRLRKFGREPEWLGAAFVELRAKYEDGK